MATLKPFSQEVNGKNLNLVLLGAREGIPIAQRLADVALPGLTAMSGQKSEAAFLEGIHKIVTSLSASELFGIADKLFKNATVNDFPIDVDTYFSGNYGEFIDFMKVALEANFKSFFATSLFSNHLYPGQQK